MPTYQYECEKCGAAFEVVQSMKDDPFAVCPKELCAKARWGKGKVRRVPSGGAGLIFKGSGFYITDYRSDSYKAAAKSDAPPASGDQKPAPKAPDPSPGGKSKNGAASPPASSGGAKG